MEDTKGFYKSDNGSLLYAPNFLILPDIGELSIELRDTYEYPILGWYYFDTEEEAKSFFNIND